ncbi:MAG: hypothetical protein ACRCYM_03550 [Cetobacterium sp.]
MNSNFSLEKYMIKIQDYLIDKVKDRDILEFRNLSDDNFPQVFFQKRIDKYLFTDSMLGVCFIKDDTKLISLESTLEVMKELLVNGYKIQNIEELTIDENIKGEDNVDSKII